MVLKGFIHKIQDHKCVSQLEYLNSAHVSSSGVQMCRIQETALALNLHF